MRSMDSRRLMSEAQARFLYAKTSRPRDYLTSRLLQNRPPCNHTYIRWDGLLLPRNIQAKDACISGISGISDILCARWCGLSYPAQLKQPMVLLSPLTSRIADLMLLVSLDRFCSLFHVGLVVEGYSDRDLDLQTHPACAAGT